MTFEIKPNRIDTESEIAALVIATIPDAASNERGIVFGSTNSDGSDVVSLGAFSLINSTGYGNTAIGVSSLYSNTTGQANTATGLSSMRLNTTGSNNTATGFESLKYNTTGYQNSAFGVSSLTSNTTGYQNSAFGVFSLTANTTGEVNTAFGYGSMISNTTGNTNSAFGQESLSSNTTGVNNTALGRSAGSSITTGSNNTVIGASSEPSSSSVSNQITLGNFQITTLRCQVTSITSLSDARDKKNIESLPTGLEFVNSLNPVKFDWDMRDGGKVDVPDTGFIAQDLMEVEDATGIADYLKLTFRDNPEKLEASYGRLVPILVKAIQDLSAKVHDLEEQING
jgi:hypothetical protein